MNEAITINETKIFNRSKFNFSDYEFLGMVYQENIEFMHYHDIESISQIREEQVKQFYYVLGKEDKVIFYNYAGSRLGFYAIGSRKDCPLIENDILNSLYLTNNRTSEQKEEYLMNFLDELNDTNLIKKFKNFFGGAELSRKREQVIEMINATTNEYIGKDYYLENKEDILEYLNFKVLDETAEIAQEENNIFAPILLKMIEFQCSLIKFFVMNPKAIKTGQLGITQKGDGYINLGQYDYNLIVDGKDVSEHSFSLPKDMKSYHTYLELSGICLSSITSRYKKEDNNLFLNEKVEKIKLDFEHNNIDQYISGLKLVKTSIKANKIVQLFGPDELDTVERMDFDLTTNDSEYLFFGISNTNDLIHDVKTFSFIKK